MDSISTSFNKAGVDHCSDRCISVIRHSYFTPDELNCFQRCTRNVFKPVQNLPRMRTDSEEIYLKTYNL